MWQGGCNDSQASVSWFTLGETCDGTSDTYAYVTLVAQVCSGCLHKLFPPVFENDKETYDEQAELESLFSMPIDWQEDAACHPPTVRRLLYWYMSGCQNYGPF